MRTGSWKEPLHLVQMLTGTPIPRELPRVYYPGCISIRKLDVMEWLQKGAEGWEAPDDSPTASLRPTHLLPWHKLTVWEHLVATRLNSGSESQPQKVTDHTGQADLGFRSKIKEQSHISLVLLRLRGCCGISAAAPGSWSVPTYPFLELFFPLLTANNLWFTDFFLSKHATPSMQSEFVYFPASPFMWGLWLSISLQASNTNFTWLLSEKWAGTESHKQLDQ